jgi:hypothetical protein
MLVGLKLAGLTMGGSISPAMPYKGMVKIISPKDRAELDGLYDALHEAQKRVAAALRTEPPGHMLEGAALTQLLAAEENEASIRRRLKEILGG